ncbi:MAG: hypothetical protein IJ130_08245 [Solobacterium sp.]|nr:hypothetical protein [Erysipelotrichaceae bacterium]MBQ9153791.1 hypothetical protein [Solobacterium sp.]
MKREDLIPYLNKFITVTLHDGSERSGYITNPQDFKHPGAEDPELDMVNGFLIESVKVSDIIKIDVPKREETVSLPVIGETSGFHIPEE